MYLLPIASQFECKGSRVASNRAMQWGEQIVKPIFESKDDLEVMYLIAKKCGFRRSRCSRTSRSMNNLPVAEDILREMNRGSWSTGYCGQSPERIKSHMAQSGRLRHADPAGDETARTRATTTACPGRAGDRPRSGIRAHRCSTTRTSHAMDGGGTFRARFGVEREEKRPDGTTVKVSLLADGYASKIRRSRTDIRSSRLAC